MDLHCETIMNQYRENLATYEKLKEVVNSYLKKFVDELKMCVNIVESRVKESNSLVGKLELKGYKYKSIFDITDIVGARVVTFYQDQVDKVASLVEKYFDVDWENSIDKRKIYNVDQFGYMSLHFVCRIPESLFKDEQYPNLNKIRFEVQIRTTLQHTWASIYHDSGYKNDIEVPSEYIRSLNRLAGLLEMADEEFNKIRTSLSEYRRNVKQIIKSGDFKDIELNGDTFKEYLKIGPFDRINQKIASINDMEIESIEYSRLLQLFKSFGLKTLDDLNNLIKDNEEDAFRLAASQFSSTDLDIMSSLTGPQFLCCSYAVKNGFGIKGIEQVLDRLYGPRSNNIKYAEKILAMSTKLGINE